MPEEGPSGDYYEAGSPSEIGLLTKVHGKSQGSLDVSIQDAKAYEKAAFLKTLPKKSSR